MCKKERRKIKKLAIEVEIICQYSKLHDELVCLFVYVICSNFSLVTISVLNYGSFCCFLLIQILCSLENSDNYRPHVQTIKHKLIHPPTVQNNHEGELGNAYKILLAFSGLKQALTTNPGYNRRVAECQEAAKILLQ